MSTAAARYSMSSCFLPPGIIAAQSVVMVTLVRARPKTISGASLSARYGLTRRELQVASLATEGSSAAEIAHTLGISTHTARHHLERVRAKLGVHRIAAVASAIRDGQFK